METLTKGQLLYWCREIPEVMGGTPNAHRLFYQVALRCNAQGRLVNQHRKPISFATCAKKAGIKQKSMQSRALNELIDLNLLYKSPRGGGGIRLETVRELFQRVQQANEEQGSLLVTDAVHAEGTPGFAYCEPLVNSHKEIKERALREISLLDEETNAMEDDVPCSVELF